MCNTGIVYAATVNGRQLTFEVATLWRGNIIMRDRETGSIWQQATGKALMGPLADSQLELLGGEQVRWGSWREDHPGSMLAVEPEKQPRGVVPRSLLMAVLRVVPPNIALPGLTARDKSLSAHDEVVGINVRGQARAYPLSLLKEKLAVNDEVGGLAVAVIYEREADRVRAFRRTVSGQTITITADSRGLTAQAGSLRWNHNGEPFDGSEADRLESIGVNRLWWHAWSEFNPNSSVYE
jgi:hypothetical protein